MSWGGESVDVAPDATDIVSVPFAPVLWLRPVARLRAFQGDPWLEAI